MWLVCAVDLEVQGAPVGGFEVVHASAPCVVLGFLKASPHFHDHQECGEWEVIIKSLTAQ